MIYKLKESVIVIRTEAINPISTGVVFWSHDRGTAKLRFNLQKDGISQNLPEGTNVPIRLIFKSQTAKDGYGKHDYLATIEDRVNGIVSIVLEDNILGYVGTVEGSIYIDFPNQQSLDTAGRFTFSIKRSPIDENIPELEDYYFNGFSQVIDKVETIVLQTKAEINQAADDVAKKVNDADVSLGKLNQEVKNLEGKISKGEQYFVTKSSTEKGLLIYKNNFITTEDWNSLQTSGIYYCAGATGENMPTLGILYGYLIVIKSASVIIQIFISNGNFYNRIMSGSPLTWFNWNKLSNDSTVVHNSGNESIDGFKDFLQTPTVQGVNLATETFGVTLTGGQLSGVELKEGTILKWGIPYSYDNERSRKNDLFVISSDLKTLTILKECTLQFTGKFTCQTNSSNYYAYLELVINGGDKWRAAGVAGSLNWRNDVGWFMVRKFMVGDKVTLVTGTNYTSSSVNAWGVDQVHIQEVIKA